MKIPKELWALVGVVLGFALSLFKEMFQSREKWQLEPSQYNFVGQPNPSIPRFIYFHLLVQNNSSRPRSCSLIFQIEKGGSLKPLKFRIDKADTSNNLILFYIHEGREEGLNLSCFPKFGTNYSDEFSSDSLSVAGYGYLSGMVVFALKGTNNSNNFEEKIIGQIKSDGKPRNRFEILRNSAS